MHIVPRFISVEEYGVSAFDDLARLGYDRFQIISQNTKHLRQSPPRPAREGHYFQHKFGSLDSGLFGKDLPKEWLNLEDARNVYVSTVRTAEGKFLATNDWFDIHATKKSTLLKGKFEFLLNLLAPGRNRPVGVSGKIS